MSCHVMSRLVLQCHPSKLFYDGGGVTTTRCSKRAACGNPAQSEALAASHDDHICEADCGVSGRSSLHRALALISYPLFGSRQLLRALIRAFLEMILLTSCDSVRYSLLELPCCLWRATRMALQALPSTSLARLRLHGIACCFWSSGENPA